MREQNVELHRRALDAFNKRDIEAWIAFCDPQIEFQSVHAAVGGATYQGHEGLRRYVEDIVDVWGSEFRAEPEAYFDLGEHSLLFHVVHGRGTQSGAEVAMPAAQVARWRDGLCVNFKAYADREDALRDLGVTEDALAPIAP